MNQLLTSYLEYLRKMKKYHAGYPYNLAYDYHELLPFIEFTINNLGDPFIHSNYKIDSRYFEKEVIAFFADLYHCEDAWGYITSSGTEGTLYGILLGREAFPTGILYSSVASHYSVAKAAWLYKLDHTTIAANSSGEMEIDDLVKKLDTTRPVILNVNIGTTFTGGVDDLHSILRVLEEKKIKNFFIHCDGALGGMIVPYLKKNLITFRLPIHSLSISGHKFIGTPFPCGIIITRKQFVEEFARHIEYIGSQDTTINGSRNGHAALYLWHAITKRKNRFHLEVRACMEKAKYLREKLKQAGIKSSLAPLSTTVVLELPKHEIAKKWQLATIGQEAHFVVLQNHTFEIIDEFVNDVANNYIKDVKTAKIVHK